MTTRAEATDNVAMLQAAWPAANFPDPTVRLYLNLQAPLDADLCRRAVLEFVHSARPFPPTIGEIIARVGELESARAGAPLLGAAEAVEQVERQLSICGHDGRPVFENPIVERAVNLIGWEEIRTTTERGVLRAQFRAAYLEFREAALRDAIETLAAGRALPGLDERRKMLADQREVDDRERKRIEFNRRVDQIARNNELGHDEAREFMASGLSHREFFSKKSLPAPEEAVN